MRRMILALSAAALAVPVTATLPAGWSDNAEAQSRRYRSRVVYVNCRKSPGTTGLVVGGVAGAVVGDAVIGGGVAGPVIGAVGGALAGRAIDRAASRPKRCRRVVRR